MNLHQLECFCKVAELENFRKAADQLFLTQPVVTYHIQQLENELEVELFTRTTRVVKLTSAGKAFYRRVKDIFPSLDMAVYEARQKGLEIKPYICLGLRRTMNQKILLEAVQEFTRRYPNLRIDLMPVEAAARIEPLKKGNVNMCFAYLTEVKDYEDIEYAVLYSLKLYVFMSQKHPLAKSKVLHAQDLKDEKIIMPAGFPEIRQSEDFVQIKNLGADLERESSSFEGNLMLMKTGRYISLLPSFEGEQYEGIVKIPYVSKAEDSRFVIAWRKGKLTPEMTFLVHELKKACS